MAKTKLQKQETVKKFQENLDQMRVAIFALIDGLTVKEITKLRKEMREAKVNFLGLKKTLFKLALAEKKYEAEPLKAFRGNVGIAFGLEDEVKPASILHAFAKTNKKLQFVGGLLNGKWLTPAEVKSLANLPTKEVLLAKLIGSIKAPISGLVNVCAGPLRGFVQVLKARAEKTA
ncbi:50S ribosomal protein L10 [Candidatus Parcubacteria bacterium]|jgi:large subunit ribosomal protein L10|nr:MAG: 50S ribosomal protein L10 [Candidatus Parcubacteria bacterium]